MWVGWVLCVASCLVEVGIEVRVRVRFRWRKWCVGVVVGFEDFVDGDACELGFFFGFFELDEFVMRKVLEVFGVGVRFVCLCFGC